MKTSSILLALGLGFSSSAAFADTGFAPWSVTHDAEQSREPAALESKQVVQTLGFAPWATARTTAPAGVRVERAVSASTIGFHPWS